MSTKIRSSQDLKFYLFHTNVDVVGRYDELTEEERIAEGTRQPYFEQPNFKKTKEEKEDLERLKSSAVKFQSGGLFYPKSTYPHKATIYLLNKKGKKDFKTTHSIEIPREYLQKYVNDTFRTIYVRKANAERLLPMENVIRKVVYNGEVIYNNGKENRSK